MSLLEVAAASHCECMKGVFERLAERKRALPGFDVAPAHVQGRVAALVGPSSIESLNRCGKREQTIPPVVARGGADGNCAGGAEQP